MSTYIIDVDSTPDLTIRVGYHVGTKKYWGDVSRNDLEEGEPGFYAFEGEYDTLSELSQAMRPYAQLNAKMRYMMNQERDGEAKPNRFYRFRVPDPSWNRDQFPPEQIPEEYRMNVTPPV